jgi:hypothetical protein
MSTEKRFRKINELVKALAEAEHGLAAGTLGLEGLETACDDARELFERLVVLRHRARETKLGRTIDPTAKPIPSTEGPLTKAEEPEPLRLDTRPAEVSPRQTSLIEAIESTEKETADTTNDQDAAAGNVDNTTTKPVVKKSGTNTAPSVAEKLEKAPVDDLGKAISLSHKFWFVAELFNGDRITYEKSIDKLNRFADRKEAETFVEQEVLSKLKKPADAEALATFTDLVQRRYA